MCVITFHRCIFCLSEPRLPGLIQLHIALAVDREIFLLLLHSAMSTRDAYSAFWPELALPALKLVHTFMNPDVGLLHGTGDKFAVVV